MQGSGYVNDSYLEGDVDFILGSGAVFFRNTELKALTSGGYYVQSRNGQTGKGYVFVGCKLTAAEGVNNVWLARVDPGVFPYSQVVWINSQMGPHIQPAAWLLNNATSSATVQFWESNTRDLSGAPVNVTQRAPFSRQLAPAEALQWADPAFVLGWTPRTLSAGR
jgi:pectin methylesterase-like acyl-CoA thioesterase